MPIAADQESLLIGGNSLSNQTNDPAKMEPTLDAISTTVGKPSAAALDNGYFSQANIKKLAERGVDPSLTTEGNSHFQSGKEWLSKTPESPPDDTGINVKMAFKLQTERGPAIYSQGKCTVESVIGTIKKSLGVG